MRGHEVQFCREYCAQGIKNLTEHKLFINEMWARKTHTKTKRQSVGGHDNVSEHKTQIQHALRVLRHDLIQHDNSYNTATLPTRILRHGLIQHVFYDMI